MRVFMTFLSILLVQYVYALHYLSQQKARQTFVEK